MLPRISINTLSLGEGTLEAHVAQVLRLESAAISLTVEEIVDYGPQRAARLLRDANLPVATLTHRAFGYATPAITTAARARLDATIVIAETIAAETITLTTGGRDGLPWAEAATRFADGIAPCTAHACAVGTVLSLEPTSHLYADASIAHRLTDTVTLAEYAAISVGIDVFACWTDADIEAAIAAAVGRIALVQVSDYVLGDRCLPCRAVPGDGAIPLERLLTLIERGGYRGHYDLEVIGPRIWEEGSEAALGRGLAHVAAIIGDIGVSAGP